MNYTTPWWSIALEAMTAFGTLGATIIALKLSFPDLTRHLDAVFVWDATTDYKPILLVQNRGSRIAVIDKIEVFYDRSKVSTIVFADYNILKDYSVIEPNTTVRIPVSPEWLTISQPLDIKKQRILKIVIKPRLGLKSISRQKYTYDELRGLFFGYGLFDE